MWFDGNGTFEFHDTANRGGFVRERGTADNPIVGTYTVNPDGTGTMQWVGNGSNHTRAFVIVDGGEELQLGVADGEDIGPRCRKEAITTLLRVISCTLDYLPDMERVKRALAELAPNGARVRAKREGAVTILLTIREFGATA